MLGKTETNRNGHNKTADGITQTCNQDGEIFRTTQNGVNITQVPSMNSIRKIDL